MRRLVVLMAALLVLLGSYALLADRAVTPVISHIARPAPDKADSPMKAAFVGDSYTAGAGASGPGKGFSTLIAQARGWTEINLARGGTGYVSPITDPATAQIGCGMDYCPSYTQMISEVAAAGPDIVLVNGGRNELDKGTSPEWAAGVAAFFMSLRAAVPHARIVATSPIWSGDFIPPQLFTMRWVVRRAVTDVGGQFVDLGHPLRGDPALLAADMIHPSDLGHAAIADAFTAGWVAVVVTGAAWFSHDGGFGHDCALHQNVALDLWSPWCGTFAPVTIAVGAN